MKRKKQPSCQYHLNCYLKWSPRNFEQKPPNLNHIWVNHIWYNSPTQSNSIRFKQVRLQNPRGRFPVVGFPWLSDLDPHFGSTEGFLFRWRMSRPMLRMFGDTTMGDQVLCNKKRNTTKVLILNQMMVRKQKQEKIMDESNWKSSQC